MSALAHKHQLPSRPRLFAVPGEADSAPEGAPVAAAHPAPEAAPIAATRREPASVAAAPAPLAPAGPATPAPLPGPAPATPQGRTLETALTLAWTAVSSGNPAACPVCEGHLEPRWTAGAGAIGGRCRDCGSTLE